MSSTIDAIYKDIVRLLFHINDERINTSVNKHLTEKDYSEWPNIREALYFVLEEKEKNRHNYMLRIINDYDNCNDYCNEVKSYKKSRLMDLIVHKSIGDAIKSGYWD